MYTQRLLVLLFGTFRVIASNSEKANTGMTSEALGVSVAPSFFHTCVSDGKTAKMEDVMRFKVHVIENYFLYIIFCEKNIYLAVRFLFTNTYLPAYCCTMLSFCHQGGSERKFCVLS